ncbi:MAG TPA: hypothetical protein DF613_11065 [Lachnospiraceae bacterium]|nr:hypothetical protein [Lachnospiraceae bacterium]
MKIQKTVCLCAAVFLLAGCAGSPEADIVTRKNTEALAGKAVQEDENRKPLAETKEQAPETYTWSYDNTAGTVHIDADAEVILPEKDTIPMYRLVSNGFTQEQVTGIYDYLFQGRETYRIEGSRMSKAECDAMIIELKNELADLAQAENDENKEIVGILRQRTQEDIDSLTEEYDSLPEKDPGKKIPVDATLEDVSYEEDGEKVERTALVCQSDAEDSLDVGNEGVNSSDEPLLRYRKQGRYEYHVDSGDGESVTPEEADEKIGKDMPYSFEEARALADGLIQAAGVDAELVETTLVRGHTETWDVDDGEYVLAHEDMQGLDPGLLKYQNVAELLTTSEFRPAKDYTAFQFQYARVVDGTPVAVTSSSQGSEDSTSISWSYEKIVVLVSEVGIQMVDWECPVTINETVVNDVPVLSFEDAREVFEELAPLIYEGKAEKGSDGESVQTEEVHVSRVCLSLMRVKDDGGKREGLYVPAWVFYGTETAHCHYFDPSEEDLTIEENTPWIVLAVNAVDGTVIDQVEGY